MHWYFKNIWIKCAIGIIVLLLSSDNLYSQTYTVSGYVYDEDVNPIALVNVREKDRQIGTVTDDKGYYELHLPNGRYELYFTSTGYKKYTTVVIVSDGNVEKQVVMQVDSKFLSEVTITSSKKDISKDIIKKVILAKRERKDHIVQYSFDAYIKAKVLPDTSFNDKNKKKELKEKNKEYKGKQEDSAAAAEDKLLNSMKLAEIFLKVSKAYPDKIKEERLGVKYSGGKSNNFFYTSCTAGDIDFYENMIKVPALGQTQFLSPFSINGLMMYRYKMESVHDDSSGNTIYEISFRPNSIANALLTGTVFIRGGAFMIEDIEADFPNAHTPEYQKMTVKAHYEPIENGIWMPMSYEFDYIPFKTKDHGTTWVTFEKYKVDSIIDRKKFNTELSTTTEKAYEQDSSFWNSKRTVALSPEEIAYIHHSDSLAAYRKSDQYLDSIESVTNKVTIKHIVIDGQEINNWRKKQEIALPPLVAFIDPFRPGGVRIRPFISYEKTFENKTKLILFPSFSYGFLNHDIMGDISTYYLIDPVHRTWCNLTVGKSIDNLFWGDAIVNILSRQNYYLKKQLNFKLGTEIVNGLYIYNEFQIANRSSISNYNFYSYWDSVIDPKSQYSNIPVYFNPYNAVFDKVELSYTPRQLYVREPREKIILGSKFPTFYVSYKKGIKGLMRSIIDYAYLETGVRQELNLGAVGLLNYNVQYGNFLNENNVENIDKKRIARGNPYLFFNPMNSFQAMDSTFTLKSGFVEGHFLQDFNGFLISKIPYGRYLKMTEKAGMSFLLAPERKLKYIEFYAGLEKIIKMFRFQFKLGFYAVSSFANNFSNPLQFKFGISTYDVYHNKWR